MADQPHDSRPRTLEPVANVRPGRRSGRALRLTVILCALPAALYFASVSTRGEPSRTNPHRAAAIVTHQDGGHRAAVVPQVIADAPVHPLRPATQERGTLAQEIRLCQAYGPMPTQRPPWRVASNANRTSCGPGSRGDWKHCPQTSYDSFAQGRYVEPGRTPHVHEYRLRVDDELDFVYRLTREQQTEPYELNVGDEIRVESIADPSLNRDLVVQPDGTITLLLVGQARATRQTIPQLRDRIEELYGKFYNEPTITVTPLKVNTKLEDLRATVDRRQGSGGQSRRARVTPEGTIQLPAIGSVPINGLTLSEVQQEINARYAAEVSGIEVIPVLVQRAPRFVYVLGEVAQPGRFTLEGPTTLMQALALAGSWNVGANLNQVVVFRRDHDWQLTATMLNVRAPLFARDTCPAGEVWLADSDVVVVPQGRILQIDNFIDLVFTRGIYGVFPFNGVSLNFSKLSTL